MKKILFTTLTIFGISLSANAAFFSNGFGNDERITTVRDARTMRDDTHVVLVGKIINSLGDEKYTFSDSTGQITVEIDNDDWNGVNVSPDTTVEISGEVDKGLFKRTKIDVDSVRIK